MKLLIVQLSDIHIKSSKDRIFSRDAKIIDALRNIGFKADLCLVAVTGDIAFAGTAEQYADSLYILEKLKVHLPQALDETPVEFVAIPGNHDCDFSLSTKARKSVIDTAREDNEVDSSVIESATIVQKGFFELLNLYFNRNLNLTNRLHWSYNFKVATHNVLVNCFNTAWVSELYERPGNMFYPVDYVPENQTSDISISLLHHPYNWLTPNNSREFRKKIQYISDIILTGHEHDATASITRTNLLQESTHIEAGALQESGDNSVSEFNCILVDTADHKQAVLPFKWNGSNYYSVYPIDSRWDFYHENLLRKANEFGLKAELKSWLNDLGLQLKHPQKGILSREDIFIFPDLLGVGIRKRENARATNSEKLYSHLSDSGRVIITGNSDSGKTTLCKELFKHYYDKGSVPIYINGNTDKTLYPDGRLITLLGREAEQCYTGINGEEYRQLEKSKHVLIIDDFDKISFKTGKRTAKDLITFLTSFCGTLILVANDISIQTSEVLKEGFSFITEGEAAFQQFNIQPFGHVLREQLVARWMSFDTEIDEEQLSRKIHETKGLLDTVIGNNFIPPYPVILLPLLQASQYHDRVDPTASTYGYFYELLINRALTEQANRIAISIKAGYLTYLAKYMFERDVRKLSNSECLIFHSEYEEKYDIPVNYREIIPILTETNLLEETQDGLKFRYEYIYYYYVAKSLSSRLYDVKVQDTISELIKTLHKDTSANTLLFLTHLTNDQFIVSQMVQAAATVFSNISPVYTFENIGILKEKEIKEIRDTLYQEQDFKVARQKTNEYLDELSNSQQEQTQDEDEDHMYPHKESEENLALTEKQAIYIQRIGVAMKTLQILGQLLRNHIGNMEGEVKTSLVNECVGIGLRTLNSLNQSLEPHKEDFVRAMAIVFQEENPDLTQHMATNQAINSLFQVVQNNTYSTIKRISHAIGSPELTRLYDRIFLDSNSPALRLIHTALYFDNTNTFPINVLKSTHEIVKDSPLGLSILKALTYQQFYTFYIPEKTKQMAVGLFKAQYKPQLGANPTEKAVKKK
jgi:predicted MPP superfamily phosphohydrolase